MCCNPRRIGTISSRHSKFNDTCAGVGQSNVGCSLNLFRMANYLEDEGEIRVKFANSRTSLILRRLSSMKRCCRNNDYFLAVPLFRQALAMSPVKGAKCPTD